MKTVSSFLAGAVLAAAGVAGFFVLSSSGKEAKPVVDYVRAWKVIQVASTYGLQQGDLIVSVNGRQCRSADELRAALPGVLQVFRGEKAQEFIIQVPSPELGAKTEPVGIFMLRETAPL